MTVRVEEQRLQRVQLHTRFHQLDHRLQRVVLLQLLLYLRVEEEEAEEIHDQLGRHCDRRLLVDVAVHVLQQIIRTLAVVRGLQTHALAALRIGLQTGIQAVHHAHPYRIDHFITEVGDRDLDEDRAQNDQAGVHDNVVFNNFPTPVPKKNLREELEEAWNSDSWEL